MPQANAMMQGQGMMSDCPMMGGAGGTIMIFTVSIIWILIVVALLLSIAALVKYLRSGPRG